MQNDVITSILTGLLVIVGLLQIFFLKSQKRQNQLALLQEYRIRWYEYKEQWAALIFIGRDEGEYYQVTNKRKIKKLERLVKNKKFTAPTIWALESVSNLTTLFSDICIKVLQGQLDIQDVYPIFGSRLLRQSRPLRVLLDVNYINNYSTDSTEHDFVRKEVQDWLIYHDGTRRRCLILIDMLWAEAVRLDDLSPSDIQSAAESKINTGRLSKERLISELRKVNNSRSFIKSLKFSRHLQNSEYKKWYWSRGVLKKDLEKRDQMWTNRLLRK